MIEIFEVKSHKQLKIFASYPLKLYKDCSYYVPSLRSDEMNIMNPKKNFTLPDCIVKCFLAYKDGEVAGRIAGIIQKKHNEIENKKYIRFSRFACIEDIEVAKALLEAVEKMGKDYGMEIIHGPWGFNDTDREGLLTMGFDRRSTYATEYSYEYMHKFVEELGYVDEARWVEHKIYTPEENFEKASRLAKIVQKKLKVVDVLREMPLKEVVKKYGDAWFDTYNLAYSKLDGFVPVVGKEKENVLKQFVTIINPEYMSVIVNEKGEVAAFGVLLADICPALIKHKGKLFPFGFIDFLKAIKKPTGLEMALVGERPEYINSGVNSIIINNITENAIKNGIKFVESNPNLVTNDQILLQWKFMKTEIIKERKTYSKEIK